MGLCSSIPFFKAATWLMQRVPQDAAKTIEYVMQAVAERFEVLECERFSSKSILSWPHVFMVHHCNSYIQATTFATGAAIWDICSWTCESRRSALLQVNFACSSNTGTTLQACGHLAL